MLDELAERREQLEMMLVWREGLKEIGETAVDQVVAAWHARVSGYTLNETGMQKVRQWVRKFPLDVLLEAVDTSSDCYLRYDKDDKLINDSVQTAFSKIPGVARMSSVPEGERELYYIRGIVRNRFNYVDQTACLELLKEGLLAGLTVAEMRAIATRERNWTNWRAAMNQAIERLIDG